MALYFSQRHLNILNLFLQGALFLTIFVSSYVLFKDPFEFYIGYIVILLLMPFFMKKFGIPKVFIYFFIMLLLMGSYNIMIHNNTIALFAKIFLGLMMSYLFYYYMILVYDEDIVYLFKLYLKGALFISFIGLFQFISFQIGFVYGYDYTFFLNKSWPVLGGNLGIRINSIYPEPSQFALVHAPLLFVACLNLIRGKKENPFYFPIWQSLIAIFTYFLTFSSLGYVVFFVYIILYIINMGLVRYILFIAPLFIGIFYIVYKNVPDFAERLDDSISIFETEDFTIADTHGSSIVLFDNYKVAFSNFKKNPLFGTGLGSHKLAFDKFSVTKHLKQYGLDRNSADANSMFLRIMSETGLLGLFLTIYFIFKFFISKASSPKPEYWIISSAILGLMILQLFRQGHYFINGFPFFVLLYFYNHKKATHYTPS